MGLGGAKGSIISTHLSVMLSHPKPLDVIQPNLMCDLLTCIATSKKIGPTPAALEKELKGKISFFFDYKFNFRNCLHI